MRTLLPCLLALLLLAGCAARPGPQVLDPVPPGGGGRAMTLWAATDRQPDPTHAGAFGAGRGQRLAFQRYVLSVPPGHKAAAIECPLQGAVDPERHFAVLERQDLDEGAFLDALTAREDEAATPARVALFVHGYNTNFQEGMLRLAQLVADNPEPVRPLLFSWPSDGRVAGYVADKDAVAFSRDHLVALLTRLAGDPRVGGIDLGAHSMGCWLTMEALRQLRLQGRDDVLRRLGSVVLAAPDIDLDLFREQLAVVGPLNPPLTVLASPDDRALGLSDRLGGDRVRVGSLDVSDPQIQALARDGGVQLIDISRMSATDSLNHDRFVGAVATLQKVLTPGPSQNPLRKAGAFVLDAAAAVLEVPARITRAAAGEVR